MERVSSSLPSSERSLIPSRLRFLERRLTKSSSISSNESSEDVKGPLGLNLLYSPPEPLIDFIFVHGLRGGSRKTWSFSNDYYHFWPKEWLPRDPDFKHVRIHSYGYNSNWAERRENTSDVNDFGRALLSDIHTSTHLRRGYQTSIVFIGHSLGGIVIKKAYLLAKQDPAYEHLVKRIHSMYFLGTPHRGADSASHLNSALKVSLLHGSRQYVSDLERGSMALQTINDQFRTSYGSVQIRSFYETLKTQMPTGTMLIVEKDSAVIGLPDEEMQPLNADHRYLCKYSSVLDNNYASVRNALSSTVDNILSRNNTVRLQTRNQELKQIANFLGSEGPHEDDIFEMQTPGTCQWLTDSSQFQDWLESEEMSPKYFWLTGDPATGKTILAGHTIRFLRSAGKECNYFFFKHSDARNSSAQMFLRSIAYQMAKSNADVRQALLDLNKEEVDLQVSSIDEKMVWRKIFQKCVLAVEISTPLIWIIDGLDECFHAGVLVSMMARIQPKYPLRVFISSRKSTELEKSFMAIERYTVKESISLSNLKPDIRRYIEANMQDLPVEDDEACADLVEKLVDKADGCFLWVHLVLKELEMTFVESDIINVLSEIPSGMSALYERIVTTLGDTGRSKELIKVILQWLVCAARPLSTDELREAIKWDTGQTVARLTKLLSLCSQLISIDKSGKVRLVHATAREFLLNPESDTEFFIHKADTHAQLASACLRYLASTDFEPPKGPRVGRAETQASVKSAFVSYAATSFSEHLSRSIVNSDSLLVLLNTFRCTTILSWIEHLASTGGLGTLLQTARHLDMYLKRKARSSPSLSVSSQDLDAWTKDLVHVAFGFWNYLVDYPFAIHFIIPPLCPLDSSIYRTFAAARPRPNSLRVRGLTYKEWDDRLCCMIYQDSVAAVVCQDKLLAVALSRGMIVIYRTVTCQELLRLDHGKRLRCINFAGSRSSILATAGTKHINLWNAATGQKLWSATLPHEVIDLCFFDDDNSLLVTTTGNLLYSYCTDTGNLNGSTSWQEASSHHLLQYQRAPFLAQVSIELGILAVAYRSNDLVLWDINAQTKLGSLKAKSNSNSPATGLVGLVFNPDPSINLLAIMYQDGDLTTIDPWTGESQGPVVYSGGRAMAASPNGKTLAVGHSSGSLRLHDFMTLETLHTIDLPGHEVRSIAFSIDCLRLYDVRGRQCNVWKPEILVSELFDDINSDKLSEMPVVELNDSSHVRQLMEAPAITASIDFGVVCSVLCAYENGDISLYQGPDMRVQKIFQHASHVPIHLLDWNRNVNLLASADMSGRYIVSKLDFDDTGLLKGVCTVVDDRVQTVIRQILISPSGDRFLVSSVDSDVLWDLQTTKQITCFPATARTYRQYISHPVKQSSVLLLTDQTLRYLKWETLEEISSLDSWMLALDLDQSCLLHHVLSSEEVVKFVTIFSSNNKTSDQTLSNFVAVWDPDSLTDPTSKHRVEICNSKLAACIGKTIGCYKDRLVFLDHRGWVCSTRLTELDSPTYCRHFPVISNWWANNHNPLVTVTINGEVALAVGDELAIFENVFLQKHEVLLP